MPWKSQATYEEGGIVRIEFVIKAHHLGHIEVSACPQGRESTQECFDQHRLKFVQDISHGMPADPNHPERGYLSLGEDFAIDFKLPEGVSGDNVLLQWRYISANSCLPLGYPDYFHGDNSDNVKLPEEYWNSQLNFCYYPLPLDGSRGFRKPEQFFNCAEIAIVAGSATSAELVTPESATVKQETIVATEAPVSSPVSSSLIQDLTGRIDTPDIQQIATGSPVVEGTIDWTDAPVVQASANPVASPISEQSASPTATPVAQASASPTVSPVVQASTNPTLSAETAVSKDTSVNTVPTENQAIDNVEAKEGDLDEVTEAASIDSHKNIEDDRISSIIEGSGNSVQASPLEQPDSVGSRSLPSLSIVSLVLIVQLFW